MIKCPECATYNDPLATSCAVCDFCFNCNHPANECTCTEEWIITKDFIPEEWTADTDKW